MVYTKLLKRHKIGSSHYNEIETLLFAPSKLLLMLKKLPNTEMCAKKVISKAICHGHYKKQKNVIYLIPPIKIDEEMITHINPSKISTEMLDILLSIYRKDKVNTNSSRKLDILFRKRKKDEQIAEIRRRERELFISNENLPIKKRKV